ncbi:MAG: hypothetical protein IPN17_01535 [Deltaproteobacteria bacterium]|nr:hypothetical protein [Deltaproteobacteria bacterium]
MGPVVSCMARPAFDDETWRFDPRCNRWTRLTPNVCPSARSRTAYALDARRRRMLVFGGRSRAGATGAYTLYRELWSLDLAEGRWELLGPKGEIPAARANATLVVDAASDSAILFGGNTSTDGARFTPRNDTWRLNLATLDWSRVTAASPPPARQFHAAVVRDGAMIVLGGGDANAFTGPFLTDAWRLDLAASRWSRLPLWRHRGARRAHQPLARGPRRRPGDRRRPRRRRPGQPQRRAHPRHRGAVSQRSAGDTLQTPGNGFCDFLRTSRSSTRAPRSGAAPSCWPKTPPASG